MQLNSLRTTALLSLFLGLLTTTLPCQLAVGSGSSGAGTPTATPTANAGDDTGGLPTFLLKVPGGKVQIGMDVDEFVKACSQAAFVFNPDQAHIVAAEKLRDAMRRSSSVLGRKPVQVDTFFLGKWPVKNSEFRVYIDRRRAAKIDTRAPFHWWRYGCKDNYEKALKDIRKAFPKDPRGALLYWEREGHKLPYNLKDEKGESIADHPVVFVSWRDANAFAASIGMRLPTEVELTRAMRGNGTHTWPPGEQGEDKFTQKTLQQLGMAKTSDYHTKPVGTIPAAIGPFGHVDMFGQIWQLVGDLGYGPIHDLETFVTNWKRLQKHPIGRLCQKQPVFRGNLIIAKGGSYLSYAEPIQLMLDARAPMQTTAVFESMGMRLAKSILPGYDFLYSLQRVQFDTNAFERDQDLDLAAIVGGERYTLAANGFPSDYEAVALAPVNWLINAKSVRPKNVLAATQEEPRLIGALATTASFANGTKPGLYSVFYRQAGVTRELRDAIKAGHREVVKARKAAAKKKKNSKADAKPKKAKKKKKKKVTKWRMVVKKYGLTDDDVALPKGSTGDCGFIRIDGTEIPTDRDAFILATQGKMIASLPGTNTKPSFGKPSPNTMVMEAGTGGNKDKSIAMFTFSIPLLAGKPQKVVVFNLHAVLDQAPPTADRPWRLPKNE